MVGLSTACVLYITMEGVAEHFKIDKINVQRNCLSKCNDAYMGVSEDHRAIFMVLLGLVYYYKILLYHVKSNIS